MKNWDIFNLGDIATFINGYAFKPSDWKESGLEIIRIQNLTKGAAQINYFQGSIPEKYKVTKGDILISWSGSLGVYEWQNEDAWLNQHLFKVVFDKEDVDKTFFKYLISQALDKLETQVHGATMKHITKKNFDAFQIPLPPLEQQKRIAAILDAADTYRQKTKALIAKYDELTQSLFLDMFGDPVKNEKGWEIKTINDISTIQGGYSFKSKDFIPESEKTIKVVKITNVHFEDLVWGEVDCLPNYYLEKYSNFSLNEGDILLALTRPIIKSLGTVKAITVKSIDLPCLLNQRVARIIPNEKLINKSFLLRFIFGDNFKNKIEKFSSTSLQPNVSNKQIEGIEIMLPPLLIQNQFAERVQVIEQQKAQAQASLEKAEELFASLLQKAFKRELV